MERPRTGRRPRRDRRLSRDDWIGAALKVLATEGLSALAVEPLATRLRVTKGSFYWHFRDRDELVDAALRRWAVEDTQRRIEELESVVDPAARLRALMTPGGGEAVVGRIDLAVSTGSSDPRLRRWSREHHRLWIRFATKAFAELGYGKREARHRGVLAYTAYLGLVSLVVSDPEAVGSRSAQTAYARFVRDLLVPG